MYDLIEKCLYNILFQFYKTSGFALAIGLLIVFIKVNFEGIDIIQALNKFRHKFIYDKNTRIAFVFYFYLSFLSFYLFYNTSLGRSPLANIFGVWGFVNNNGEFTSQNIENIVFFLPFYPLLIFAYPNVIHPKDSFLKFLIRLIFASILLSLGVETLQLFLQVGKIQLSDVFYSFLGQIIGAIIFCFYKFIKQK